MYIGLAIQDYLDPDFLYGATELKVGITLYIYECYTCLKEIYCLFTRLEYGRLDTG